MSQQQTRSPAQQAAAKKLSEHMKNLWANDPEWVTEQKKRMAIAMNSPEANAKRKATLLKRWEDNAWRAQQLKVMIDGHGPHTSEAMQRKIATMNANWADDEFRLAQYANRKANGYVKAPKLDDDEVREIREMLACDYRVGDIALIFDVSQPIISYIKSGKTYKHVKDLDE